MERTGTEPKARKMIGLYFQTKSFLKTSVFGVYARVLHNTLVNITNEYMGFQSAIYNPTLVCIFFPEFITVHGESQSAFGSQGGQAAR